MTNPFDVCFWPTETDSKPILNVALSGFWDRDEVIWEHYFATSHCFLWDRYDVRYNPQDPDVVFCSVFNHRQHQIAKKVPRILMVHEPLDVLPIAAGLGQYKAVISFNRQSPDIPNNIRIPYWVYRIFDIYASEEPELQGFFDDYLFRNYFRPPNPLMVDSRDYFCGMVAGKPVEWRDEVVRWLNEYKTVDCGGSLGFNLTGEEAEYMRMRLKGRDANNQKVSFMAKRLFGICMENTMDMPGYTTEKIIDVSFAGAIPIYAGQFDPDDGFNTKRLINVYDFDSKADFMAAVKAIDNSGEEQAAMRFMPVFKKYPEQFTLEALLDTYTRIFE